MPESTEESQTIRDTPDPTPAAPPGAAGSAREALVRIDALAGDLRRRYEAGEVDLDHVLGVTRALAAERARLVADDVPADDRGRRRPPFDRFVIALGAFCRFYIASEYDPGD